jgi:hypothetical protein
MSLMGQGVRLSSAAAERAEMPSSTSRLVRKRSWRIAHWQTGWVGDWAKLWRRLSSSLKNAMAGPADRSMLDSGDQLEIFPTDLHLSRADPALGADRGSGS